MPALTPCPSKHNDAWRRAEEAGQPHDLQPVWGSPVHCLGPELLAAVWLEAIHGTAANPTVQDDGDDFISCSNNECGSLFTRGEYDDHVERKTAGSKLRPAA